VSGGDDVGADLIPHVRWLDKEHGLSVTLTPDRDGDGVGDALEGGPEVEYTVSVYTSDIRQVLSFG
jgi:hypothetical protein